MYQKIMRGVTAFARRTAQDHLGAFAAASAYFLMLSFVPFIMILLSIARLLPVDVSSVMNTLISIMPSGIRDYTSTIVEEVYTKAFTIVPISVIILFWSASKFFHMMTNGLNQISKVEETRNWFVTRFRSMGLVGLLLLGIIVVLLIGMSGQTIIGLIQRSIPPLYYVIEFFLPFRKLIGYFVLILFFLFLYKFLPNRQYSFRSQLPGALIVSTVWVMFSYFVSLYYTHTGSFQNIYGTLTGIILAMIWLYFCMFFILVGAELNRIIYEDPEENVIVQTIQDVKESNAIRKELRKLEIEREKRMATGNLPNPSELDATPDLELIRKEVLARDKDFNGG